MLHKAHTLVQRVGVIGAVQHVAAVAYWQYVIYRDDTRFDRRYGVETSRIETDYLKQVQSAHVAGATFYEATKQRDFEKMMRRVPVDRRTATFVDAGCGKGRVLLFAALAGFETIVGVEFSDALAQIARRNVDIFARRTTTRASISVLTQDIASYDLPDADVVFYMYNPFGAEVMRIVIDRLVDFSRRTGRRVHVAYRNPKCAALFASHPAIETIESRPEHAVYAVIPSAARDLPFRTR